MVIQSERKMIIFNWKALMRHSKGSSSTIISIIDYLVYKPIPRNLDDIAWKWSQIDWKGDSFLLRPEPLLRLRYGGTRHDVEIAHYIGLASWRNYPEYQATGKLSLDLLACLGMEDIINQNSLLYIEKDEVHFKYEEAHKE
jgi:hypothetical protein